MRVVTKKLENTKAVTVLILVGAGSRYEKKQLNGISHFLEHMFFKGAKKYKTTKEVSEAIDGVGGDFNAFTGKEYAGYFVKVAREHLDLALDVLSDMLIHSKFDPAEIDKERGVIMEEYNMYQDTPMYQIGWNFEKLVYGDQPIGWDQVGTKEVIMGIKQRDFQQYKSELYTPDNTVIAIAGNIDSEKVVKKVEELFVFDGVAKAYPFNPVTKIATDQRVLLQNKKTEQAHVMLGFPGYPDTHENIYAAKLLAVVLGGNMSSRMFLSVREAQGLAYYINSNTDDYSDTGIFTTNSGVSLEGIDRAVAAIIGEYKRVLEEPIGSRELKKAQDFMKGKMVLRLEDSEENAHLLGKYELLHGKIRTPEEIMKRIDKVTTGDLLQVARDIFKPSGLCLAVIGPYDDSARFEKLLKF